MSFPEKNVEFLWKPNPSLEDARKWIGGSEMKEVIERIKSCSNWGKEFPPRETIKKVVQHLKEKKDMATAILELCGFTRGDSVKTVETLIADVGFYAEDHWPYYDEQDFYPYPEEKPYNCDQCEFSTVYISSIRKHMLAKHGTDGTYLYKCKLCKFETNYMLSLKRHVRSHGIDANEISIGEECESEAIDGSGADREVFLEGTQIFECEICEFRTLYPTALKRHSMIHTGEKPYECTICDYKSAYKSALKVHIARHEEKASGVLKEEVKPYKCGKCDYETGFASALKSHQASHSSRNKYKCDICSFESNRANTMKMHRRNHRHIFAMSEEMNLPERLEISPDKSDCCKQDETRSSQSQRHSINSDDEPERILEGLSISPCTKGRYTLNEVTDSRKKGLKRFVNRRPILRKSKLSQAVLRAPVLRLPGDGGADLSSCSPPLATTPEGVRPLTALLPDPSSGSPEEAPGASSQSLPVNQDGRRSASTAQSTCCAVQARLSAHAPPPSSSPSDDTSMDELASYFDIFVHIPKKMSQMAEMMYI